MAMIDTSLVCTSIILSTTSCYNPYLGKIVGSIFPVPPALTTRFTGRYTDISRRYYKEFKSGVLTPSVYATLENKFGPVLHYYSVYCCLSRKTVSELNMLYCNLRQFYFKKGIDIKLCIF